ncbi:unnamed protein product [Paramecium primaurelia]|uniref:TLDc domain-containing protein n=1 Tax=Paramecium primaurelia TaxID=5886 RepID=A0A8S1PSQ5_PARPR|nr:unnamed protein product [Paramecium primaurelia]
MGNCVTNRTKISTNLDKPQKQYIHQAFIRQTLTNPESRNQLLLFEENFNEIFDDIPYLGQYAYWFLLGLQNNELKGIEYQTILQFSEIFILGNSHNEMLTLPNRVSLIIAIIILFGNLNIQNALKEFSSMQITYLLTSKCLQVFISMMIRKSNINELPIKSFVDGIFSRLDVNIPILQFVKFIDTFMPSLEEIIEDYYYDKFLGEQKLFHSPQLNNPSHILNQEWLALMYLCFMHKDTSKLELLYSNVLNDNSFELLTNLLIHQSSSYLFIIQCEHAARKYIFGAYTNFEWKDDALPNGSKEDCIFQLFPQFRVYRTKNDKFTRSQYVYLNSKNEELAKGIGFGGELAKEFRIFINSDLQTVQCKNHDKTYEPGELMPFKQGKITLMEVWTIQQIQGTTQFKDLIQQKMEDQIEFEEFEIPQIRLDEDISSYRSGEHSQLNQSINELKQKDSCDWEGSSQNGFEEEIIIKNDGYEEVKKNEKEFEIVELNDSNNKTSINIQNQVVVNNNQFEFEEVAINTTDKMESSALQVVYNVKSGKFGDASQDDNWNGDNSDWKGDTSSSSKPKEMLISQDLKIINENLQDQTNTEL